MSKILISCSQNYNINPILLPKTSFCCIIKFFYINLGLSITATISFDRQSMMGGMRGEMPDMENGERPSFDRTEFQELMGNASALTLEEYQAYAAADSVKDFYYSNTVSLNGNDGFEPVTTETDEESKDGLTGGMGMPGGFGGFGDKMGSSADFQIVGYSDEDAMTAFLSGTATVTDGTVFEEGTAALECLISEELATYNSLAVGDTVTVTNPADETETYTLTVVGLYADSSANAGSFGMFGGMVDPANKLYMSYAALQTIVDAAATGENELSGSLEATYVFADVEAYESFESEVRELGLSDDYTVSSQDLTAYENSLTPLNTLSTMAGWFLLVILIIGGIILIVLNIFNIRERKYEIGVLTAMGMKKGKVAAQFITEIFVVTLAAVLIGVCIGAVCAVPVTNALLENQVTSQQSQMDRVEQNFGRPGNMGGNMGDMQPPGDLPSGGDMGQMFGDMFDRGTEYITEINSAMNLTVVLQMLGIAVLLTLVAGTVSVLFVMRYEPLKILANRD